jgi:hypothetical protein
VKEAYSSPCIQGYTVFDIADRGIDRPIAIDDDVDSPKQTASTQGLINEKH